jgi:hypothetical protein
VREVGVALAVLAKAGGAFDAIWQMIGSHDT